MVLINFVFVSLKFFEQSKRTHKRKLLSQKFHL